MIKARIDVKWNDDNVIKDVEHVADMVLEGACILVQGQAQRHVAPGVGPSIHPHKDPGREDTGELMNDIQVGDVYHEGNSLVREVGNTEKTYYGSILEAGWFAHGTGNFWRYPWLYPALEISVGPIRRMVQGIRL